MRRFVAVGRLGGVPVYIHWTLLAASALVLLGSLESVSRLAVAGVAPVVAYFAAMLVHEWGHVVLARKRMCQVYEIELYPFVGLTRFTHPRTRFDHCIIAWGGILFQGAVGIPILAWILLVGYTPVEMLNNFMAIFGYLTLVMLPLNLAPIPPLDGAIAWGIVPMLLQRLRERLRRRRRKGWQSAR